MDARFRLLGKRRRVSIRDIGRAAYIDNPETAFAEAEKVLRRRYSGILSMLLIGIALAFLRALIEHWLASGVKRPHLYFQPGEPGADA